MDYKELSEHYYKLTGCEAFDEPTLILRFIMSDELRPYLTKISYKGILKHQTCLSEINLYYNFDLGHFRTRYMLDSCDPTLLGLVLNNIKTIHIAEYLLNNWNLFYDTIDQFLYDILHACLFDTHLYYYHYNEIDEDDIIIKFCSHWDIIPIINKFQSENVKSLSQYSIEFMHYLVCLYDVNHEYEIKYINNLLRICIEKGYDLEKFVNGYNIIEINNKYDVIPLVVHALHLKNKSSFLYLYNNILLESVDVEHLILLMGYDDELLKITDKFKTNDINLAEKLKTTVATIYKKPYRTLEEYMKGINKHVKNVKIFVNQIKNSHYFPSKNHILFDLLYHKLDDFRGDVLDGEILKNEYSIDVLFKPNSNPQIWKQNFMLMLQLHRNYYMLTVSSY